MYQNTTTTMRRSNNNNNSNNKQNQKWNNDDNDNNNNDKKEKNHNNNDNNRNNNKKKSSTIQSNLNVGLLLFLFHYMITLWNENITILRNNPSVKNNHFSETASQQQQEVDEVVFIETDDDDTSHNFVHDDQLLASTTSCMKLNDNNNEAYVYDIVIIGAGISGLSAYAELKKHDPNLHIIIVEATNRIGGRMKKSYIDNTTIEIGANWLHSYDTPFALLAKQNQLQTFGTKYLDIEVYNEYGKLITNQYENEYYQFTNKKNGPFYLLLLAAKQYWDDRNNRLKNRINRRYNGTEDIMKLMIEQFHYVEDNELKAYIRWIMIDYEYLFKDHIGLLNFYSPYEDLTNPKDVEAFVIDSRGFEYILYQFMIRHQIHLHTYIHLNTKVTDIIYNNHRELDDTYKVLIYTVDNKEVIGEEMINCKKTYKAKRVIVTVPVSILRGNGYKIQFQPTLQIEKLPSYTGQYNKVFFTFDHNFWGTTKQFIGILRPLKYRDVCNHWSNMNTNIPNSNILMCTLTTSGMEKFLSMNLTTYDLLEPLRIVYGYDVVNNAYKDVVMSRWDLDPSSGYGAYASFMSGYTLDQYYSFWGGYRTHQGFMKGEGYNQFNEWIVHLSGAASCFEYNEQVDGAYFSGQRSARNVLRSFGSSSKYSHIQPLRECEDF